MTARGETLDAGPFVAALEQATGTDAVLVGKPGGLIFSEALARIASRVRISSDQVLMVGDSYRADIVGAAEQGFRTCLVSNGADWHKQLTRAVHPDVVVGSLQELMVEC